MRTKFAIHVSILFLAACLAACNQADPVERPQSAPASSTSSKVEGLSASMFLSEQHNKYEETMKALTGAKERGDMGSFQRILQLRSIELAKAITEVSTGSYSIADKDKMINVLQQEKDWADASLVALAQ